MFLRTANNNQNFIKVIRITAKMFGTGGRLYAIWSKINFNYKIVLFAFKYGGEGWHSRTTRMLLYFYNSLNLLLKCWLMVLLGVIINTHAVYIKIYQFIIFLSTSIAKILFYNIKMNGKCVGITQQRIKPI